MMMGGPGRCQFMGQEADTKKWRLGMLEECLHQPNLYPAH